MTDHQDSHVRLAKRLEQMPHGFPPADDGVDLALLRWAFTPEEAALAVDLPPAPATAEAIAELMGKPVAELTAMLNRMCYQGQIGGFKQDGKDVYAFIPWLPGLQEGQLYRLDRTPEQKLEYVHLWERYLPTFSKIASYDPPLARVVPVGTGIKSEARPHRLEDVHRMVDSAKSFRLAPCVCREERAFVNSACNHLSEVCLVASAEDDDFANSAGIGRLITKEEAHKILDLSEADGLVHQTWNADHRSQFWICNCCPCCCVLLRPMTQYGQTHATESNFVAWIDMEECIRCGDCVNDRCPVNAISETDGDYAINQSLCFGCGVCTVTCPVEVIKLNRKPEQHSPLAPMDWAVARVTNRAGAQ